MSCSRCPIFRPFWIFVFADFEQFHIWWFVNLGVLGMTYETIWLFWFIFLCNRAHMWRPLSLSVLNIVTTSRCQLHLLVHKGKPDELASRRGRNNVTVLYCITVGIGDHLLGAVFVWVECMGSCMSPISLVIWCTSSSCIKFTVQNVGGRGFGI